MSKFFVVCDNYHQFQTWCYENKISYLSPFVEYLPENHLEIMNGVINPVIIFYGGWKNRCDIDEIQLFIASRNFSLDNNRSTHREYYLPISTKSISGMKFIKWLLKFVGYK